MLPVTPGSPSYLIRQNRNEQIIMRFPRFRFTIRRMMIVVAIVAVLVTAERLRRIRSYRLQKAEDYSAAEQAYLADVRKFDAQFTTPRAINEAFSSRRIMSLMRSQGRIRKLGEHSGKLKRTYEKAARYPWLPVEPDPPEPD
jgi:hypothetical protein